MKKDNPFITLLKKAHIIAGEIEGEENIKNTAAPSKQEAKKVKVTSTRVVTFDDLKKQSKKLKVDSFEELVPEGDETTYRFETIFEKANIQTPRHGWNVFKVVDYMDTNLAMGENNAKMALLGAMKVDKAKPEELLVNAFNHDQAMDKFELFLSSRITKRAERLTAENAELEKKVKELQQHIEKNMKRIDEDQKYFETWKREKVALEERMARATSYLTINQQAVSIGSVTENKQ
ncbi:MAG: hypothetical protein RDV48_22735 [Candidatus Eremiobacteraeota bacterium]|nr:hypothetical protein [Candidatus Eremiobacteraeota bacterium]